LLHYKAVFNIDSVVTQGRESTGISLVEYFQVLARVAGPLKNCDSFAAVMFSWFRVRSKNVVQKAH